MKKLILLCALLAPAAHAEDAELLKVTGIGFSCQLGAGIELITQDKMGRIRQSPTMDFDQNTGQLMAIDHDGSFPIGSMPEAAYLAYRDVCDHDGDTLPRGVNVTLMPDLKVYLIKEQATRENPGFNNCQGDFLAPWWARHCTYEPGIPVQYEKDTFVFVRQNERVDRSGGMDAPLLKR
ncbi:MAG: hypothetical protein ACXVB9_06975 [Bdellovibrionota bacterium]